MNTMSKYLLNIYLYCGLLLFLKSSLGESLDFFLVGGEFSELDVLLDLAEQQQQNIFLILFNIFVMFIFGLLMTKNFN